jgi:hypothetical protein
MTFCVTAKTVCLNMRISDFPYVVSLHIWNMLFLTKEGIYKMSSCLRYLLLDVQWLFSWPTRAHWRKQCGCGWEGRLHLTDATTHLYLYCTCDISGKFHIVTCREEIPIAQCLPMFDISLDLLRRERVQHGRRCVPDPDRLVSQNHADPRHRRGSQPLDVERNRLRVF